MLKFLLLTTSLWAASIPLITETALTRPLSINKSSDLDKPVCYMQTPNGATVNLSSLCVKKPNPQPQEVTEQNNRKIEGEVNEQESGKASAQSEIFDANGNKLKTTSSVACMGADCNAVITPVSP